MVKRIMIFIDGGYLRPQLRECFDNDRIDYGILVRQLNQSAVVGPTYPDLVRAYYYDAVPDPEQEVIYDQQKRYLKLVGNNDFVEVRTGRLKEKSSGALRQKGVDTLIAIDMLSKAYENHYDIAVLLAGDDDFLDLVKAVKNAGKQVYGAFFLGHVSEALKDEFDRRLFLDKSKLTPAHEAMNPGPT